MYSFEVLSKADFHWSVGVLTATICKFTHHDYSSLDLVHDDDDSASSHLPLKTPPPLRAHPSVHWLVALFHREASRAVGRQRIACEPRLPRPLRNGTATSRGWGLRSGT